MSDVVTKAAKLAGNLFATVASKDALDVRQFWVSEAMSSLFEVKIEAVSSNPDIDFDAVVGHAARFELHAPLPAEAGTRRFWSGICNHLELVRAEASGLSTYALTIVPNLWLTTQRRNYRIFQQVSEPDIVKKLLAEWEIKPVMRLTGRYKARKYRVQYGESDHAFMSRMMEDLGISYYFEQRDDETVLVITDTPHTNEPRKERIGFIDNAVRAEREHVTNVSISRRVRPGRYTMQDHDYRRAATNQPRATAGASAGTESATGLTTIEKKLERFHYTPGAFLFHADKGDATPAADDRGMTRTDEDEALRMAQNRLDAKRGRSKVCTFHTNAHDLSPGVVMGMLDHPRTDLGPDKRWLIAATTVSGKRDEAWTHHCEARSADIPFRPALLTPKPQTPGVESATVVGPVNDEIHTDEFGRVRVHFHWDRESKMNEMSSCWLHVNQPWSGAGYGGTNLPRVGQEVLVDFLNGDPDRPVIVGRVYTNLQKTPYGLVANKTQSGWKSNSSPTTGGYNELMFEDKAGEELVRMQAEKDLHKLVKHDEQVKIGRNRSKHVGNDDHHTVANDRTHDVGHDENCAVGNDRTHTVGKDEHIKIGNDQHKHVGGSHHSHIGKDLIKHIAKDAIKHVGKSLMNQIGEHARHVIGENLTVTVGNNLRVMIGNEATLVAEEKITLQCGSSTIIMEPDKITVTADELIIQGKDKLTAQAYDGKAEFKAKDDLEVSSEGGDMTIKAPMVYINE